MWLWGAAADILCLTKLSELDAILFACFCLPFCQFWLFSAVIRHYLSLGVCVLLWATHQRGCRGRIQTDARRCSSLLILCMWLIFHLHFLLQFVQRQSRNIELIKLFYVFWCKTVVRTWFLVTLTTLFDAAQLVSGNISPDYLRISDVEVLTQRFFSTCAAHLICRFLLLKRSLIAMPDKATEGIPEGCS